MSVSISEGTLSSIGVSTGGARKNRSSGTDDVLRYPLADSREVLSLAPRATIGLGVVSCAACSKNLIRFVALFAVALVGLGRDELDGVDGKAFATSRSMMERS